MDGESGESREQDVTGTTGGKSEIERLIRG